MTFRCGFDCKNQIFGMGSTSQRESVLLNKLHDVTNLDERLARVIFDIWQAFWPSKSPPLIGFALTGMETGCGVLL